MPVNRREFLRIGLAAAGVGGGRLPIGGRALPDLREHVSPTCAQPSTFFRRPTPGASHGYPPRVPDAHRAGEVGWWTRRIPCQPDVVVCTGDYVLERRGTREIDRVWPVLGGLRAPLGVYSVLGNHDHWADTTRSLERLTESGQSLRHRAQALERGGSRIWLGGAGDLWEDDLGIDTALRGVPPDECRIVLAHNPDSADQDFAARVDLMISGHTHGGQVRLPLLSSWTPNVSNQRYDRRLRHRRARARVHLPGHRVVRPAGPLQLPPRDRGAGAYRRPNHRMRPIMINMAPRAVMKASPTLV